MEERGVGCEAAHGSALFHIRPDKQVYKFVINLYRQPDPLNGGMRCFQSYSDGILIDHSQDMESTAVKVAVSPSGRL
jgi:hypothetical protein